MNDNINFQNLDQNALFNLALLRDYTAAVIGVDVGEIIGVSDFSSKEESEYWRMRSKIPRVVVEQAERWDINLYELIYLSSRAWLEIQSRETKAPILGIEKGRVWLDLTLQKESAQEVRVDLWELYSAGYSYLESLTIIAAEMRGRGEDDMIKEWRQIRDALNKMVKRGDKHTPLIMTRIKQILYYNLYGV